MVPGVRDVSNNSSAALTDEEFLVFKAKEAQKDDAFAAKAWLMTARSLFPFNFKIQFEAYWMHKQSGNEVEAARHLELMFRNFPSEENLWQEVRLILDCLRQEATAATTMQDANSKFLKAIYYSLPVDVQRGLLLTAAEKTTETIEHCKLVIMLLEMFPECTVQQGLKLVDTLLMAEKHSNISVPVNSMRKLLVCDILPVVLRAPAVDIPHNVLYRLLHKSIEFCVYCVIKPHGYEELTMAGGLWDKTGTPETPWLNLGGIVEGMGQKFGWDLGHMFKTNDYESQWHSLQGTCRQRQVPLDDPSSPFYLQIFYCAVILFLRSLCEYICLVDPSQSNVTSVEKPEGCILVLVEGLKAQSNPLIERPKAKKQKLDEGKDDPELSVSNKASVVPSNLVHCFFTAARCWDLLHASERIATDFANLCNQLGIDSWFSFQSFQIDILIYKGLHSEAIQWLSTLTVPNLFGYQEKLSLQAACCYYQLGEYVTACSKTMDIVCYISEKTQTAADRTQSSIQFVKPVRHLVFLTNKMTDVLHFCIKLLITRLNKIVLHPSLSNDIALGHLLVLLQYDLTQEENLFIDIINQIQMRGGLTYNNFFNYIINIDILEEFAHLSSNAGGNLSFNLLSASSSQAIKQRAITRGVNKGAKEELKVALEKQVARCEEPLQPILVQFLIQERDTLFQNVHGARL